LVRLSRTFVIRLDVPRHRLDLQFLRHRQRLTLRRISSSQLKDVTTLVVNVAATFVEDGANQQDAACVSLYRVWSLIMFAVTKKF